MLLQKENLTKGQRVFYFSPIRVTQGSSIGDRKVAKTKIKELSFRFIYKSGASFDTIKNGKVVKDGGVLIHNDNISCFNTEEEAIKERDRQYMIANLEVENNLRNYIIELQQRLDELKNSNAHLLIKQYS